MYETIDQGAGTVSVDRRPDLRRNEQTLGPTSDPSTTSTTTPPSDTTGAPSTTTNSSTTTTGFGRGVPATANQVRGSSGPDNLVGTDQSDSVNALAGVDTIFAKLGDNFVDGGLGDDTALFVSVRKSHTFAGGPGSRATVSGPEGNDSYLNVEHFKFVDGEIVTSATTPAGQVYRVYEATLNRAPDAAGLRFWNDQLEHGVPLQRMVDGFTGSPEFTGKYGGTTSNLAFVNLLYENVLGRPGEAAGVQSWVTALELGTSRAQVVLGFSESQENINKSQSQIESGLWVGDAEAAVAARVYYTTLGRAPDVAGLKFWADALNAGTPVNTMVDGFTNSSEFRSKYGALDNSAFVDLLYLNVLGRPPEPAGKASWVNALNSGAAMRADVVLGFSESQEHINKLSPVIDDGIIIA